MSCVNRLLTDDANFQGHIVNKMCSDTEHMRTGFLACSCPPFHVAEFTYESVMCNTCVNIDMSERKERKEFKRGKKESMKSSSLVSLHNRIAPGRN